MKALKRIFLVLGIIIFLVLALTCFSVYILYDNSVKDNPYKDVQTDFNYEINSLISYSLVDTKTTGIVDASVNEDKINILLASLSNTLNKEFKEKVNINGFNLSIKDENKMEISIYFKVLGFPSSLKGGFTLIDNDNDIILQINDASVGKITSNNKKIGNLLKTFVSDKKIKESLKDKGIIIDIKIDELKISLNKKDIPSMIENTLKDDPNKDLYSTLVEMIFDNNLINIVSSNHEIGIDANLQKLSYDSFKFYDLPYSYDYESIKTKTEILLNSKIINYENCGKVFDYLVRGWEKVSKNDDEKNYEFIKSLDLSSIGITNNTLYKGIISMPKKSMAQIIANQTPSLKDILNPALDIKIYESDFNAILLNTGVIGISYAFARCEDDLYKISYLYVESLYTKIVDDRLDIIITININGKQIALMCTLNTSGSSGLTINTLVNGIDLGEISLNDNQIKSILSYLNNIMQDEEWFIVDKDNSKITFNFVKIFSDNEVLNLIVNKSANTSCGLYSSTDEGYIKISLSGFSIL